MKLGPATILKIKSSSLFRAQGENVIEILNLESNQIYHVRDLAAHLWFQMDGRKTLEQVIVKSQKKFAIKNPQYSRLAKRFFEEVFLANLVEVLDKKSEHLSPASYPLKVAALEPDLASLKLHVRPLENAMAAAGCGSGSGGCASSGCGVSCS